MVFHNKNITFNFLQAEKFLFTIIFRAAQVQET